MATATLSEVMVPASKSLAGKVALVTGASRGIGRAIALELASRGATVAVNCRSNVMRAGEVRDEIVHFGGTSEIFQADVSDRGEARHLIQEVLEVYEKIDVLVNNAGITRDKSLRKMTDDDWNEVIETNLNSVFYCTSASLPKMIERNYGRIVNISSFIAQGGNFGQANYAASKGGIISFTKVLALELAKYNITANVIAPGFTETDMLGHVPSEVLEQIKQRIPMHRLALPEEVAKAAAFLICDGDYVTGQQINVNGGIYM
jgi:Dehydrogenases with different specificities (related to short-chain alcohol dehydrogenases)